MGMNVGYLTAGRGPESDECMTPFYACKPLLKYISKDWTICYGDGYFAKSIEDKFSEQEIEQVKKKLKIRCQILKTLQSKCWSNAGKCKPESNNL